MVRRDVAMLVAGLCVLAGAARAQETAGGVTPYPAAFFADAHPSNAYDMLLRVPGFSLDPGDSDVRGLADATGNVLIDGRRPASKQDDLEDVLKRIPAASVERIELIRAGAAGVDMQGRALVANVVRRREATVRGEVEAELAAYRDGRLGPQLSGELTRRNGERLLELSAAVGRQAEDDKGRGPKLRVSPSGALLEAFDYVEVEREDALRGALGYETPWRGGSLRLDVSALREATRADIREQELTPEDSLELVEEREDVFQGEAGGQYRRGFGPWSAELTGLHRWSWSHARDASVEGDETDLVRENFDASETILRAVARRDAGRWTFEAGGEVAVNVLDSHSALELDGEAVDLPFANVRVEERRGEAFATATWRHRSDLTLEGGLRVEHSVLRQSGDSQLTKPLSYVKPRALVSWQASTRDELRLELDRHVGQLDFGDFVSSTSLTSETVTAGNPDLEPERYWRVSATWERRFGEGGALTLALRHDWIQDVVDHVLIEGPDFALDAIGNIGEGRRTEAQFTATVPLQGLGVPGGLLNADILWRESRVTDPFTGARRRISEEPRLEGTMRFTQDLPGGRIRWGVDAELGVEEVQYMFDEIRTDTEEARVAAFVEYRADSGWRWRLEAENLASGRILRRREQYDGPRGSDPLDRIEIRELDFGPFLAISARRLLGAR